MLILTRRSGETIRIGNDVSVTVLGITGQQARIGISAPESIAVHREEVHQRIQTGVADKPVLSPTEAHAQFIEDHLGKLPADQQPMHIDDRVRMVNAEPAFLTVVFKVPSLNDAKALLEQLPFREKALGTEAEVFGYSAGNLMGSTPCEQ